MARGLSRGEIWLCRFARPDKRRPVLVLSRQDAIDFMTTVLVAPLTSTIRGLPSEVVLGPESGLKSASAVNLDHTQTVRQSELKRYVGSVGPDVMSAVCRALAIAAGCAAVSPHRARPPT